MARTRSLDQHAHNRRMCTMPMTSGATGAVQLWATLAVEPGDRNHCRAAVGTVSLWYRHDMALTLRTDEELEHALTTLAEQEGLSRQEIIRRAVLERYERAGHRARVDDSAQRMVDRWGDVLERLGSG